MIVQLCWSGGGQDGEGVMHKRATWMAENGEDSDHTKSGHSKAVPRRNRIKTEQIIMGEGLNTTLPPDISFVNFLPFLARIFIWHVHEESVDALQWSVHFVEGRGLVKKNLNLVPKLTAPFLAVPIVPYVGWIGCF